LTAPHGDYHFKGIRKCQSNLLVDKQALLKLLTWIWITVALVENPSVKQDQNKYVTENSVIHMDSAARSMWMTDFSDRSMWITDFNVLDLRHAWFF
jgi:hypothetical protein